MKRRNFLTGAVAITLAEFLAGCETQADLKVKLLKNSIPAQMMSKFRGELRSPYNNLSFKPIESLTELFSMLQDWQRKLLLENNVEVYRGMKKKLGNCGGGGQCGFCAVEFLESEGWQKRSDYETNKIVNSPDARLACLNNVQGPATLRIT